MEAASTTAAHAVIEADATSDRVAALTTAVARVGGIVKLITDIAGQTNLLALNATIRSLDKALGA